MNHYTRVLFLVAYCLATPLVGQQILPLSNFMNNQFIYNPASAGMQESQFNVSILTKLQGVNLDKGSPKTAFLWTDYRFKSNRMALGFNLGSSSYSGYKNLDANLSYAYHLDVTRKMKLSMGLRAGIASSSFSTNGFQIWDDGDAVIDNSNYQKIVPKIGVGFHLKQGGSYLGIASADFFSTQKVDITGDTASSFFKRKRNIVVMSGTRLKLGDLYNLRPAVAMFYYPDSKLMVKINSTFEIKDYFWAGLTYSTNGFGAVNLGTNISSRIRFGYSFETYLASKGVGLSAHEINLLVTMDNLFRKRK